VDVAEHLVHARAAERGAAALAARVEPEVERAARRVAEHVVAERVAVGPLDRAAGADDAHVREERLLPHQHVRARRLGARRRRRLRGPRRAAARPRGIGPRGVAPRGAVRGGEGGRARGRGVGAARVAGADRRHAVAQVARDDGELAHRAPEQAHRVGAGGRRGRGGRGGARGRGPGRGRARRVERLQVHDRVFDAAAAVERDDARHLGRRARGAARCGAVAAPLARTRHTDEDWGGDDRARPHRPLPRHAFPLHSPSCPPMTLREKAIRGSSPRSATICGAVLVAALATGAAGARAQEPAPRPSPVPTSTPADTVPGRTAADTSADSVLARLQRAEEAIALLRQQLAAQAASATQSQSRARFDIGGRVLVNGFLNSRGVNNVDVPQFVRPDAQAGPRAGGLGGRSGRPRSRARRSCRACSAPTSPAT
jgi:hypothetical protein